MTLEIFSFKGRLNRTKYVLQSFGLLFLQIACMSAMGRLDRPVPDLLDIVMAVIFLFLGAPMSVKRLHDMSKSDLYYYVPCAIFLFGFSTYAIFGQDVTNLWSLMGQTLLVLNSSACVLLFIWMAFTPGVASDNKYGSKPQ